MHAWALLLVVLSQELANPAPKDPLVPQAMGDSVAADEGPGAAARIPAAIGMGALAAGGMTVAWYFLGNMRCGGLTGAASIDCSSGQVFGGIIATLFGVAGVMVAPWGGHRMLGGKGRLGWSVLGAFTGAVVGGVAFGLGAGLSRTPSIPAWGPFLATSAVGVLGASFMLELGHHLVVREEPTLLPVVDPNGAGLALAGRF